MKAKIKIWYSNLEKKPKLIGGIGLGFFLGSFLLGIFLGKTLESQRKNYLLGIVKEREAKETKILEETFSKLSQKRFLEMVAK